MKVGILGGGQLGRMLALAGVPLGVQFRVLEPAAECPAESVADRIRADFTDSQALARFAEGLDVITYEFENVPVEAARALAQHVPVRPTPEALAVTQDRFTEKSFLRDLGFPVPPFADIRDRSELDTAVHHLGLPAVLKTRRFGYDGRGQCVIRTPADVGPAWAELGGRPLILESFINFDREFSLIAVRALSGEVRFYPPVENVHRSGMLFRSVVPAALPDSVGRIAREHVERLLDRLDYVGVLAAEWFQRGDQIWLNEVAPRVHNSGHWTIEGSQTSQFENHLRAILSWPLGEVVRSPQVAMWNLIGSLPEIQRVLNLPATHLHFYGKQTRPGRKLGHVTLCDEEPARFDETFDELERLLSSET